METCANTYYLNKYLDEQDKAEEAQSNIDVLVNTPLNEIEGLAKVHDLVMKMLDEDSDREAILDMVGNKAVSFQDEVMGYADHFEGYDFHDYLVDEVNRVKGDLDL